METLFTTGEFEGSRTKLTREVKLGKIKKITRGLYALEESLTGEDTGLAEIS
jgi:hypothetical protein